MPPVPSFRSSGDLRADRRYEYARAAFDEGDPAAAADLARQVLELAPGFAVAHALLGRALIALGETEAAVSPFEQALALEPDDALGVRLDLARLGRVPAEAAITQGYVRALFDDYAPTFERHLVKNLSYCGPDLLADALRRAASKRFRPFRFGRALDLGCGTGLMGEALAGVCETLEGVDLSPRMLAKAAKTRAYAALHEAELGSFLADCPDGSAELIVAADVFVYIADLAPIFRESARILTRDGFLAFTVQAHEAEGVALGEDARYAHGAAYLRGALGAAGFDTVLFEDVSTRMDRGEPVPGLLVVAEPRALSRRMASGEVGASPCPSPQWDPSHPKTV
jgi:predicted TPR repeat methyltransferase